MHFREGGSVRNTNSDITNGYMKYDNYLTNNYDKIVSERKSFAKIYKRKNNF